MERCVRFAIILQISVFAAQSAVMCARLTGVNLTVPYATLEGKRTRLFQNKFINSPAAAPPATSHVELTLKYNSKMAVITAIPIAAGSINEALPS